jgi:hypothetical protein
MTRVSETQEDYLKSVIRDAMAIDPLVTVRSLQKITEKKANRALSFEYIIKLQRKIRGEVKIRPDRERYENRLAFLRERNRIVCAELFRIAFPDPNSMDIKPGVTERRKALEAIFRIEKDMIKLEMDLGLFTRQLGTVEIEHRLKPIDDKTLENIMQTFKVWAEPPQMRKIERREPIEVQVKETPHEPANNTATSTTTTAIIPIATGTRMVPTE